MQELRKVIAELRDIPLDFSATDEVKPLIEKVAPKVISPAEVKPAGPRHAFVPAAQFDESVLHIRGIHASAAIVQAGNEKLGSIETQAKAATDALIAACDNIQSTLLSIDEKLFKVN